MFGRKKNEVHIIYHGARERRVRAQVRMWFILIGLFLAVLICTFAYSVVFH